MKVYASHEQNQPFPLLSKDNSPAQVGESLCPNFRAIQIFGIF